MADMSWRNTMRRFVRSAMTGSAATAITNAITSRLRRGTATVPPSTPPASEARERPVALHQPRSLRAMAGEQVLGDNRQSSFNVVDKNTAMKNIQFLRKLHRRYPWMNTHFSPWQS